MPCAYSISRQSSSAAVLSAPQLGMESFVDDAELDFDTFCKLVRGHEEGPSQALSDDQLRARFQQLDADGSGTISRFEYEGGLILDALAQRADPFALFTMADTNGNRTLDREEFATAIRALGIMVDSAPVSDQSIAIVFDLFDEDVSR